MLLGTLSVARTVRRRNSTNRPSPALHTLAACTAAVVLALPVPAGAACEGNEPEATGGPVAGAASEGASPAKGATTTERSGQAPPSAAETLGRIPGQVRCLDAAVLDEVGAARRRKGVQKRPFRKRLRATVEIAGGAYAGDLSDTQWQTGGRLAFWVTETFGFDVAYRLTPMTLRLERSATAFTGADRYPDGVRENLAHTILGHLAWAPFHTKLRAGRERVVHGDFILYAGAGPTLHDSRRGLGVEFGGAFALYPVRWLSVRLDLADHVLAQEILGSRRLSNSLVFSLGLGIWIPFR